MLSAPDFKQKQIIVALVNHGERFSFKNDNIIITNKDDVIIHQSSCYRLFALFIIGHTTITTGLLQRSKKFGFNITFLSYGLIPYGSWGAKAEGNVILRKKQYDYTGTAIAQLLVINKIEQQILALKQIRNKSDKLKKSIKALQNYKNKLPNNTYNIQEILGVEGIASRVYFAEMFNDMEWKGRKPRVKHDKINLLLDIGYTQLFHFIDALLNLYGFDIYKGVYHQTFYQRKSLVCDLVEPFRVLIDKRIRKAYKLNQIHDEDFFFRNGQYKLMGKKGKPYILFLLQSLLKNKQEIFIYIQSYYRAFMQDKPIDKYPIFIENKSSCL